MPAAACLAESLSIRSVPTLYTNGAEESAVQRGRERKFHTVTRNMESRTVSGFRSARRAARRKRRMERRGELVFVLLIFIGVGAMVWTRGGARWLGLFFGLLGALGLASKGRALVARLIAAERTREASARREALRAGRRERSERERVRRRIAQEERSAARIRLEAARRTRREQARDDQLVAASEAAARGARLEEVAAEISRYDDAALHSAVGQILALRRIQLEAAPAEYSGDSVWRDDRDELLVSRCVPVDRHASGGDVRALEAWMASVGAAHAHLISARGFEASAVEASGPNMTLVDPHLLALWSQPSSQSTSERSAPL